MIKGIRWRITWAIARKDIIGALKDKTIQGVMIGILTMMLSGRVLPLMTRLSDNKTLVVYDRGKSRTILQLRKQDRMRLARAESQAEMEEMLGTAPEAYLGLVLPADFDQAVAEGRVPDLEGHVAHWARQAEVQELQTVFSRALSEVAAPSAGIEMPIAIQVATERVYPPPDGQGFSSLATGVVVLTTLTVGIFLVPYLIGDERQTRTMDALLVSPASIGQIVTGKAIAGSVYCSLTAAITVAFSAKLFVHWWVVVATLACGTLFAVGVGLLLGALFELPQHMNAVAAILLAVLLVPIYLAGRLGMPPAVEAFLANVPSAALNAALSMSLARTVPLGALGLKLGSVLALSALIYAVTIWQIRRSDR
jgi:ABC-2 type transport system permease protein